MFRKETKYLIGSTLIIALALYLLFHTSDYDKRISASNSHKILDRICERIDSTTCIDLRKEYKMVLLRKGLGYKGEASIIIEYGIRYEDITFRDLIKDAE